MVTGEFSEIPQEEGYLSEFKDYSGGVSVADLSRTLCAFANTEGGVVYLGVTDKRDIKGLKITSLLLDHVQNAAREGCQPPVSIKLSRIPVHSNREVLIISVEKSSHLHSVASGQTYIRVGTQDKRVLGDELLRLAETKTQVSFEENLLQGGIEAVDLGVLNQYYEARKKVSSVGPKLNPEDLLLKIGLAHRDHAIFRIKAGAFILFGKEGESLFLQRDFTFVRYEREGGMYSYREDLSLPLTRLIDRLLELLRPHIRETIGVSGVHRQERFFYPEEAIREALLNAIAHRDYRLSGLKNECRLYPDRLEIISAGSLPGIITLENIDKRHYSRNPKIMHALVILGFVEELGQGISLMKSALKKNDNPPPEFSTSPDQFKVVFRKPRQVRSENDIRQILDNHFVSNPFISRRQIEALTGLGSTSIKYLIRKLLDEEYLTLVGQGPATRYKKG